MPDRAVGDRLVLSPLGPLIGGGPAEAFEPHLRQLNKSGHRHRMPMRRFRPFLELVKQLMTEGAGVTSLAWEHKKREKP
jgi:hypothetical protein